MHLILRKYINGSNGFSNGDGLGTKAVIWEQIATIMNNTEMKKTLINQGFSPPWRMGTK
jgi:hypothetical protein